MMVSLLLATLLALPVTKVAPVIKVACVGDSITFGFALANETIRQKFCYPSVLGQRLGGGYEVQNFGHTGCTLMNLDWLPPLMKTEEYKKSLEFKPNVVILMGGTNDGAPRNWEHIEQLPADIKKIAHSYEMLPSHPRVYLVIPPRICTKKEKGVIDDDHCNNVNQSLPPMLRSIAKANVLTIIDSRAVISTRDCYTVDGIHLSEKGNAKLANQIAFVLLQKKTGRK